MKKKILIAAGLFALILSIVLAVNYFAFLKRPLLVGEVRQLSDSKSAQKNDSQNIKPVNYRVEKFVSELEVPWSFVWTSANRMLVTERGGQVRVIKDGVLQTQSIYTFQNVSVTGEAGLLSVALDPNYEKNKYVYFSLIRNDGNGPKLEVVRMKDEGDKLSDEKIIIGNIAAAQYHDGSALSFGPDGKMYLTTGDATDKNSAQDLNSLNGKVLRINPDGTVPSDNPFPDSLVYSYGHRNSQGIDWHPVTGELYASEHGPSVFDGPAGGDEVNRIIAGENYGWPSVSHEKSLDGAKDPLTVFTPAEAPASMMVYSGKIFPQFANNLFFGALKGEGIVRLVLDKNNPDKIIEIEKLADVNFGRIRYVAEGPDGYIYFSTSNRDGRGKPQLGDDKIYRLVPME